ncbi:NPA1P protein, partial [Pycnonotus jocosus]|nr:NPA1P protein [Pycnonotus jocosus]
MDQLPAALERAGNEQSWAVADAIPGVLKNSEELHSWRRRLLSACMKGLVAVYSSSKDESEQGAEKSVLLRLEEL